LKKQYKWLAATGIILSASLQPAFSQTGLLEVYQQATQQDPQLLASEMGLKATEERVDQSFSALLPTISGSITRSRSDSEGQQNIFFPPATTDTTSTSKSLTLSQVIYDHRAWTGLDIRKKQALKAGVDHESVKQNLILRVSEAYFNVLAAQDGVDFSTAEMKAIKQELEQTNQKFEVGLIAITDVHEAQARYDQAVANNIQAQNTLDNASEALREISNRYYQSLNPLQTQFKLKTPQPNNIDDWLTQAEQSNLNLSARKIDKDIARETIKLNFAGHYPYLNLSASYSDSDSDSTSTQAQLDGNGDVILDGNGNPVFGTSERSTINERSSVSLSLNVPIYSGGETQSKVREAQHMFQQAVHNMDSAYRAAARQTRSAFLGIQASISSVKALEQSTVSSQAALEATQAGFEVGTRTIVDVLNATRTLYNAKQNLARARYDYILNTLKLKQAAGTLSVQDLKQVDQLLKN
jgi:outer membrane protein